MQLPRDTAAHVAIFAASGVIHLAKPEFYEPLMPGWLPAHREIILARSQSEPSHRTKAAFFVPFASRMSVSASSHMTCPNQTAR